MLFPDFERKHMEKNEQTHILLTSQLLMKFSEAFQSKLTTLLENKNLDDSRTEQICWFSLFAIFWPQMRQNLSHAT